MARWHGKRMYSDWTRMIEVEVFHLYLFIYTALSNARFLSRAKLRSPWTRLNGGDCNCEWVTCSKSLHNLLSSLIHAWDWHCQSYVVNDVVKPLMFKSALYSTIYYLYRHGERVRAIDMAVGLLWYHGNNAFHCVLDIICNNKCFKLRPLGWSNFLSYNFSGTFSASRRSIQSPSMYNCIFPILYSCAFEFESLPRSCFYGINGILTASDTIRR